MQNRMKVGVFCLSLILVTFFARSGSAKTKEVAVEYGSKLLTPLLRNLEAHDNTLSRLIAESVDGRMFPILFALSKLKNGLSETGKKITDLTVPVADIFDMLQQYGLPIELDPRLSRMTSSDLIEKAKKEFVRMLFAIESSARTSVKSDDKEAIVIFATLLYVRAMLEAHSHLIRLNSKEGEENSLHKRVYVYTKALYSVREIVDPDGYHREFPEEGTELTDSDLVEHLGNYFKDVVDNGVQDFESGGVYFPMNLLVTDTIAAIVYPLVEFYKESKPLSETPEKITDLLSAVRIGASTLNSLGFVFNGTLVSMRDNPVAWLIKNSKGRPNRWKLALKATGFTSLIQVPQKDLNRFLPGGPD